MGMVKDKKNTLQLSKCPLTKITGQGNRTGGFFSALTEFFNCRGDLYVGSLKHILSSFCIVAAALYRVRMYRMRYRVVQTR